VAAALGTTASLIAIMALANLALGASHLYDKEKSYEWGIAELLAQGRNVAGLENYDDRALQRARADLERGRTTQWIVMGSSRAAQISGRMLGSSALLNLSVAGASIEDHVALLHLFAEIAPGKFILCVDPWIFNRHNGQDRWKGIGDAYLDGLTRIGVAQEEDIRNVAVPRDGDFGAALEKVLTLVSFQQTRSSLRTLGRILDGHPARYYAKDDDNAEDSSDVLRADGSRGHNRKFTQAAQHDVERFATTYARAPVYSMEQYEFLDARSVMLFVRILDYLRARSNAYILLPPYHPTTYRLIAPRYPRIREAEEFVRQAAASRGMPVFGSFDPGVARCEKAEFFDGTHPSPACIRKLVAPLIGDRR
jgi:hypothetical protein